MIDLSKRILITGANGYIWTNLVSTLRILGAEKLFCTTSATWNNSDEWLTWYYCDISNRDQVNNMIHDIAPQYVIHLWALGARNSQTSYSLEEFINVNGFGTQFIIDALQKEGCIEWFLNISSIYEYGPQLSPITETTPINPIWGYAISKTISSTYLTKQSVEYNFPGTTYRLSPVYGPNDNGRIVPLILEAFLQKKELNLSDIHRKRDLIFIDDIISAILEFDKVIKKHINVVNVWNSESFTLIELVSKISHILWVSIPETIIFHNSEEAITHWEVDNKRYLDILLPKITSFEKWIQIVIDQYKHSLL